MRIPIVFVLLMAGAVQAENAPRHGELRGEPPVAWDERAERWVTPEEFWRRYADANGGLTWGQGRAYPPYREVKEHDTFLVEVDSGLCLMEFFHTRWRRANDVRRWDPSFNDVSGCPDVFK